MECPCETIADLVKLLQVSYHKANGNYHPGYHYYTTLSGFAFMLLTRKLRLTNITSLGMNDLKEPREFGDKRLWRRLYIACFSTRTSDSNPMWGLYGVPADEAICITIPPCVMAQMAATRRIYVEKDAKELAWSDVDNPQRVAERFALLKGKKTLKHHDVAYFSNLYRRNDDDPIVLKLYRREDCLANLDLSHFGCRALGLLTGYAKRRVWEYEDESRLRLKVQGSCKKKHLYLELPESFFHKVHVTLGPLFDAEKRRLHLLNTASVREVFDRYLSLRTDEEIDSAIKTSGYMGLLQYASMGGMLNKTEKKVSHSASKYKFHGKRVIRECRSAETLIAQLHKIKKG